MSVKYPNVKVQLSGRDGNAFAILARVRTAMKEADIPEEEIAAFLKEAKSGNYEHLLCTCMDWVDVDGDEEDDDSDDDYAYSPDDDE